MTHPRAAELAMARASIDFTEDACIGWLGVGRLTLERIEAGEIEPSDATEARINRFLDSRGGSAPSAALPGPARQHGAGPTDGGATRSAVFFGGPQ